MGLGTSLRSHRYVLIGVFGGIPLAIAWIIWSPFNITRQPHLRLTIGRCAPFIAAIHPADCAYIDSHPSLVLVGPGRLIGGSSHVRVIRADASRKVDVALGIGWYDVGIPLPDHRIVQTSIPDSELFLLWLDQHHGTISPDDHWRLDSHRA
jgi:hypothetical protein